MRVKKLDLSLDLSKTNTRVTVPLSRAVQDLLDKAVNMGSLTHATGGKILK